MSKNRQKPKSRIQKHIGLSAQRVVSPEDKNLPERSRKKLHALLLYLTLALTTLAVYWPVRSYDFVNYDDPEYITENEHVNAGITLESVVWAFTTPYAANWNPVTQLSHMLDCQLFGLRAGAHHLTSLLFHIANALLLFGVLKRMTGAVWLSAFVAATFALHPLRVESVAWISERKDVLSVFFWMLTMWAYVRYAEHPNPARYVLIVVFFVLGLMAKPMLMTLPFVLLLLDYWPLDRLQLGRQNAVKPLSHSKSVRNSYQRYSVRRLIVEKIPLFILVVVSGVIIFIVQQSKGALGLTELLSLKVRIVNALVSYIKYTGKMIWPSRLAVFYPHPGDRLPMWQAVVAALLLLVISIWVIRLARSHKYLPVGWLWYLGTLVPVIGLIQTGSHAMADRFTYIPSVGIFIMVAWGVPDILSRWRHRNIALAFAAPLMLVALMPATRLQVRHWRNSITLCEHAINVTNDNFVAYSGLGAELCRQNKLDEGMAYLTKALQIMPGHHNAHCNMAVALARQGKFKGAIDHYQQALRIEPDNIETQNSLAAVLEDQQKTEQAISYYTRANTLADQGKFDEAVEYYRKAIELKPNFITAHGRLGLALAGAGRVDEAINEFRIVLTERPDDVEMYCNVGIILARQGKFAEAIEQYHRALKIDPGYAKASRYLSAALAELAKQENH